MVLSDFTSFWWESITGPQMLVDRISACLEDGRNVVLQTGGGLPWREQMRDFVAHRMGRVSLYPLSLGGGYTREQIIPLLLEKLCRSRAAVCPTDYKAQLNYLKNEGIFANSVVWISQDSGGDHTALLRFLSDYRGKGLERHGAFVLEAPDTQALSRLLSERCILLSADDFIRRGDKLLFANMLADGCKADSELKGYMACAAATLAGQDIELIPEILHGIEFDREDPGEALSRMWDEGSLPCPDERPGGQELQLRVWEAQLQSVFARIEMERLDIADQYRELIEQAMNTEYWEPKADQHNKHKTGFISQRGDELESASDVELGTLVRMMSLRRNDDHTLPLLAFPQPELRNRIIFLTKCRNSLAHHRACTPEQIMGLLGVQRTEDTGWTGT